MIPEVRRGLVDGVTVLNTGSSDGHSAAMLMFRVGRFDETLPTAGITHLVEHLACSGLGTPGYQFNAEVNGRFTTFVMAGGQAPDVTDFVAAVCRGLTADHSSRIEQERRVLRTEAASRGGPGGIGLCLLERYGAAGPGLAGYEEYGLRKVHWDQVDSWRQRWFVAENAVLCVVGELPADLRVDLPTGQVPAMSALPQWAGQLPAFTVIGRSGIGMSMTGTGSVASAAALTILQQRLTHDLRHEHGLSYSVAASAEHLDASTRHAWLAADALRESAPMAAHVALGTFEKLIDSGCTADELADYSRRTRDAYESQAGGLLAMHGQAQNLLTDRPVRSPDETLRLIGDLSGGEIAAAAKDLFSSMIFASPGLLPAVQGRLPRLPQWSSAEIEDGVRYQSQGSQASLTIGDQGVMLTVEPGHFASVPAGQVAALLKWNDSKLTLIGLDGFRIEIDPAAWDGADAAIRKLESGVPDDLIVPIDAAGPAAQTAVASAAATTPAPGAGSQAGDVRSAAVTRKRIRSRQTVAAVILAAWAAILIIALATRVITPPMFGIFLAASFGSTLWRLAEIRRRKSKLRSKGGP